MPLLSIENVSKYYLSPQTKERFCVFEDITLQQREHEILGILGHSGCGKTTLLNIIAGIEQPSSGRVLMGGKPVQGPSLDRMMVFQTFALMPWLTVLGNVRLAMRYAFPKKNRREIDDRAMHYLDMVGLRGAEHRKPSALSNGMRQRVGLARAFAVQPRLLLLDEPFGQIDPLTRGHIQDELVAMWKQSQNTIFLVTHDVDEAMYLCDRVILFSPGPNARIQDHVGVNFPRPRTRQGIMNNEDYYMIRNEIIRLLSLTSETAPPPRGAPSFNSR